MANKIVHMALVLLFFIIVPAHSLSCGPDDE